ncbi:hypothetical protein A1O3_00036 [Capronia epimyces CBS 606.96]|uniref:Uncharacterized protein n=1 Tax=Capronia epimyces CBS 606.96 TaxID=1182542 RepID=W9YG33_9EURO|nr:uncharacterized protein A1O3_00036 [Capronia epimyces CBS 606.96]EXJ91488.1 hypothetical protein A1O3_00036 [Capronia epimyces CBS 606.96]
MSAQASQPVRWSPGWYPPKPVNADEQVIWAVRYRDQFSKSLKEESVRADIVKWCISNVGFFRTGSLVGWEEKLRLFMNITLEKENKRPRTLLGPNGRWVEDWAKVREAEKVSGRRSRDGDYARAMDQWLVFVGEKVDQLRRAKKPGIVKTAKTAKTTTARPAQYSEEYERRFCENLSLRRRDRLPLESVNSGSGGPALASESTPTLPVATPAPTPTLQGSVTTLQDSVPTLRGSVPTLRGSVPTLRGSVPTLRGSVRRDRGRGTSRSTLGSPTRYRRKVDPYQGLIKALTRFSQNIGEGLKAIAATSAVNRDVEERLLAIRRHQQEAQLRKKAFVERLDKLLEHQQEAQLRAKAFDERLDKALALIEALHDKS